MQTKDCLSSARRPVPPLQRPPGTVIGLKSGMIEGCDADRSFGCTNFEAVRELRNYVNYPIARTAQSTFQKAVTGRAGLYNSGGTHVLKKRSCLTACRNPCQSYVVSFTARLCTCGREESDASLFAAQIQPHVAGGPKPALSRKSGGSGASIARASCRW